LTASRCGRCGLEHQVEQAAALAEASQAADAALAARSAWLAGALAAQRLSPYPVDAVRHVASLDPQPVPAGLGLADLTHCANCTWPLEGVVCRRCGFNHVFEGAAELGRLSEVAAGALEARAALLDQMLAGQDAVRWSLQLVPGSRPAPTQGPGGAPGWAPPPTGPGVAPAYGPAAAAVPGGIGQPVPGWQGYAPYPPYVPAAPPQPLDVTGLLAGIGAGLVGVAALVFAFFTLRDDPGPRIAVMAVATVAAAVAAVRMKGRGLRASSEGMAVMAAAFLAVDLGLLKAELTSGHALVYGLMFALTLVSAAGLTAGGRAVGLRTWLSCGLVVAPLSALWLISAFRSQHATVRVTIACLSLVAIAAAARHVIRLWRGPAAAAEDQALAVWAALALLIGSMVALSGTVAALGAESFEAAQLAGPRWLAPVALVVAAGLALVAGARWLLAFGVAAGVLLTLAAYVTGAAALDASPSWPGLAGLLALAVWLALAGLTRFGAGPGAARQGLAIGGLAGALVLTLPLALWRAFELLFVFDVLDTLDGRDGSLSAWRVILGNELSDWTAVNTVALILPALTVAACLLLPVQGRLLAWLHRKGTVVLPAVGLFCVALLVTMPGWPALASMVALAVVTALALMAARALLRHPAAAAPAKPRPAAAGPGLPGPPPGWPPGTWLVAAPPVGVISAGATAPSGSTPAVTAQVGSVPAGAAAPSGSTPGVAAQVDSVRAGAAAPSGSTPEAWWPRPWTWVLRCSALGLLPLLWLISWMARPLVPVGTVLLAGLLWAAARLFPRPAMVVAVAVGYPLVLQAAGLAAVWYVPADWFADPEGLVALGGVGALACLGAAVLSLSRWPHRWTWYLVCGLSLAPAGLATLVLFHNRNWWSTAAALAVTVLMATVAATPRRALPVALRAAAAALVLPAAAMGLAGVGSLLLPGSASPVLVPVIAGVAAAAGIAATALQPRAVAVAGLISATATAWASVAVAVAWPQTDNVTVLVTCALVAAGSAAVGWLHQAGAGWAWASAAAGALGVLWAALGLGQVDLAEAFTVPPALAAVATGWFLSRRQPLWEGLTLAGLGLGLIPSLVLEVGGHGLVPRALGLTVAAALLLAVAGLVPAGSGPVGRVPVGRVPVGPAPAGSGPAGPVPAGPAPAGSGPAVRRPFGIGAIVAAGGPAWLGIELANWSGDDWAHGTFRHLQAYPTAQFGLIVALLAAAGLAVALGCAALAPLTGRWGDWYLAPGLAVAALGPVIGMRFTWWIVAITWLIMAGLLALGYISAHRQAAGRGGLPPYWFCWPLALAVGIAGWSTRELRVECWAIPLGLALFAAGHSLLGKYPGRQVFLVGPGIAATLGPSTLAVGTDPMTWRAILVIGLAMAAMLYGARRQWKHALVIAAAAMALTLILVFVRRSEISTLPWLLTLACAGGILFSVAVWLERAKHHP
jgi:hypothetical protein